MMFGLFESFKQKHPEKPPVVYRLFWKNPLAFWRWSDYLSDDPHYKLPYKDWNEIKKKHPESDIDF